MPEQTPSPEESDSLYLNTVYPEASAVFEFAPRPLEQVLGEAVFVLDTNALLVPYGTDPASLAAIRGTYKTLLSKNRLVVPGQAAREFAKNRPERLKLIYDQIAKRQNLSLSTMQYPLLAESSEYNALKTLEQELATKLDAYRSALRAVLKKIRGWYWDDPVSAMYREMFGPGVVVDGKVDIGNLRKDLSFRATHKVPPGYKDAGKEIGAAGDLLIWRTILELGESRKSDVVFVSGEEKSDWWYRTSEGVLYPRYELLDEYRRASGGRSFHILPLADLLERFGADDVVVEDVREQEAVVAEQNELSMARQRLKNSAKVAVLRWASSQGTLARDERGRTLLQQPDGRLVALFVHIVSDTSLPSHWIRQRYESWIRRGEAAGEPFMLVAVALDRASALRLGHRLAKYYSQASLVPTDATTSFGYLRQDEFVPVARMEGNRLILEAF